MLLIHIFILVFIGIPGFLLTRIIGFLLNKKGYKDKLPKFYKYSSTLLIAFIAFLFLFEKSFRTQYASFKLNESIEIEIKAVERESFLDNPTDFTFSIRNLVSSQKLTFDYFTNDLYPFKFYLHKENENLLVISEDGGVYWIINLETLKQEKRKTEFLKETNFKLKEVATLNHFHKIQPTEPKD